MPPATGTPDEEENAACAADAASCCWLAAAAATAAAYAGEVGHCCTEAGDLDLTRLDAACISACASLCSFAFACAAAAAMTADPGLIVIECDLSFSCCEGPSEAVNCLRSSMEFLLGSDKGATSFLAVEAEEGVEKEEGAELLDVVEEEEEGPAL